MPTRFTFLMIDIKQVQTEIEASLLFQNWKKQHHAYLVHFFCMDEKEVQVGYYDEKTEVIATFVKAEEITKTEDKEIFRQEKKIALLDMHNVKISMKDAVQKAEALQKQMTMLKHQLLPRAAQRVEFMKNISPRTMQGLDAHKSVMSDYLDLKLKAVDLRIDYEKNFQEILQLTENE